MSQTRSSGDPNARRSSPHDQDNRERDDRERDDRVIPHDQHWAVMVSLYPEDFTDAERHEAEALLSHEGADDFLGALEKVRTAQTDLYTPHYHPPILNDAARI